VHPTVAKGAILGIGGVVGALDGDGGPSARDGEVSVLVGIVAEDDADGLGSDLIGGGGRGTKVGNLIVGSRPGGKSVEPYLMHLIILVGIDRYVELTLSPN